MVIAKRCLLWDYTNTRDIPSSINQLPFSSSSPISSVANWNTWPPPELRARLPFHPTIRTPAHLSGPEWDLLLQSVAASSSSPSPSSPLSPPPILVHFLIEPERQTPPIPPPTAATLWCTHVLPALRPVPHARLVGPACASDAAGRAWLRAFMAALPAAGASRPDCTGAHYYGTSSADARAYLEGLHAEFGLPVVVGEVGCVSRDGGEVGRFTREVANWADGTGWVVGYGFFGCMREVADEFVSPAAQLMDKDGVFTPLMRKLMTEQPMT